MSKALMFGTLALALSALSASLAWAKKEANCPSGVCQVQIKHAEVQPACPGQPLSNVGCVLVNGNTEQTQEATITWEAFNAQFCYIFVTDPTATSTNGIRTYFFDPDPATGVVNGLLTFQPFADTAGIAITVNINCRGLAQFNEQNSTVISSTTIRTIQ
jgi:hypothetical protein